MYHDIVSANDKTSGFQNDSAFQYKVDESAFEEQVKALQGKDVVFSFDDGGVSFYTKAAPILEKYGFKGVFFISTKYIDTPGFLSREQLVALASRGHAIGSHSHSHPHNFTKLTLDEVQFEWKESYRILKSIIGDNLVPVSIPNGYSSRMILEEAVNCGYSDIYNSKPTTKIKVLHNHKVIGRYVVHDKMTTDEVVRIVESSSNRIKIRLRWLMLETIKKVLGNNYDKVKALIVAK